MVRGDIDPMPGNFGSDYVSLTFRNGSTFEVCGALESTRGLRKFGQVFRSKISYPTFL